MFPEFDRSHVRYLMTHRERYVEPLHGLNGLHQIPSIMTPVENLYLATTAQIYPELTNAESLTQHGRRVAGIISDQQFGHEPFSAENALAEMIKEPLASQHA